MKFSDLYKDKKTFKMGFLGGSITYGTGASKPNKRYSSVFTATMNKIAPETEFIEVNAGVGGTGSSLGCYRVKPELLDVGIDMLFIEFAVNDIGWGKSVMKYYESIIRQAKEKNPAFPIVILFGYRKGMYDNGDPESVLDEIELAKYYDIPYIRVGEGIHNKVLDFGGNPLMFTRDNVHPNDEGYQSYVDIIMHDIFRIEFKDTFPAKPLATPSIDNPYWILAENLPYDKNWRVSTRTFFDSFMKYIACDVPGATIEFDFTGISLGAYVLFCKDSGIFDLYVDGKLLVHQTTFDRFCKEFDRNAYVLLADELENTKHHAKLVISDERPEGSEGHIIRIGAITIG